MPVKKYRSELVSFQNPFKGIYSLEFRSLDGKFKYHPGQFLHIAIDPDFDGTGQWPESRCFSMHSNPDEETIKITYSVKGRFTNQMEQELKVGSIVWLKLPYGELFTQHHNKEKTVFIAGGTGITPFLSLFTHESFSDYKDPRIYLGFKSIQYNIYMDKLNLIKPHDLKIFYEDKDGLIDINLVFLENGIDSSYFISGPPVMIKLFRQSLISKGVHPSNVLTDEWE
jgi:ferredoxin-NADP reductase